MKEPEKQKTNEAGFEFYNRWGYPSFDLFSIALEKDIFVHVNSLHIIIFNFEFRFYIPK